MHRACVCSALIKVEVAAVADHGLSVEGSCPDVLFLERAVSPFGNGDHATPALELADDTGPFSRSEGDRVGGDLGRRSSSRLHVGLHGVDVLLESPRCVAGCPFQSTRTSSMSWWANAPCQSALFHPVKSPGAVARYAARPRSRSGARGPRSPPAPTDPAGGSSSGRSSPGSGSPTQRSAPPPCTSLPSTSPPASPPCSPTLSRCSSCCRPGRSTPSGPASRPSPAWRSASPASCCGGAWRWRIGRIAPARLRWGRYGGDAHRSPPRRHR